MRTKTPTRSIAVPPPAAPHAWTFLSNHTHVLLCVARDPHVRIREIADLVGITERMVQKILGDLAAADYLTVAKDGRRNSYHLSAGRPLRHPLEANCQVGQLLDLLREGAVTPRASR